VAGDKDKPKPDKVQFAELSEDSMRGLVVASQRAGQPRVKVHVSLHGLPPADGPEPYRILADQRPCSIAGDFNADGNVDAADFLVWRTSIIMANTEGDFHVKSTRRRAPLRSAQSIRVFHRADDGKPEQLACGRAQGWATFPSDR
jgi:hypothetical protein